MLQKSLVGAQKPSVTWLAFFLGMAGPLIWVLPQVLISLMSDLDPDVAILIFDWSKILAILVSVGFIGLRAYQLRNGGFAHEGSAWLTGIMSGAALAILALGISFASMLSS